MVFVYGSLHKKCLVLWKERYFVLKVRDRERPGRVVLIRPRLRRANSTQAHTHRRKRTHAVHPQISHSERTATRHYFLPSFGRVTLGDHCLLLLAERASLVSSCHHTITLMLTLRGTQTQSKCTAAAAARPSRACEHSRVHGC